MTFLLKNEFTAWANDEIYPLIEGYRYAKGLSIRSLSPRAQHILARAGEDRSHSSVRQASRLSSPVSHGPSGPSSIYIVSPGSLPCLFRPRCVFSDTEFMPETVSAGSCLCPQSERMFVSP